ncbi:MAG: succinate dehydrogenase assembly factor 2 [Rhodospirillales bacterium]|nr:succinate dehydrogenase assembly factor 2 [Rhodospirillales bacterium]
MSDARVDEAQARALSRPPCGMRESDLLIGTFADRHLADLDDAEVGWFEWLLMNHDDLAIYNWITGRTPAPVRRTITR